MRRKTGVPAAIACALLVLGGLVSSATAAQPVRAPYEPDPTVLERGQACDFDVTITTEPGSNYTETQFSEVPLRFHITGSGHDTVTNTSAVPAKSITLPTSGKITLKELPNGDYRVQVSGRTVFFFWEGDQGPFGEVGVPGALYYIVGQVTETIDQDTGAITSFAFKGKATELCSLIT